MNSVGRLVVVDTLKGIAIVAVLLIHATQLVPDGHPLREAARIVDDACRFAVPLFMGVLGFWCGAAIDRPVDWRSFYAEKARRLLPAYLVWGVAYWFSPPVPGFGPWSGSPISGVLLGFVETHLYFVVAYVGLLLVFRPLRALLRVVTAAHARTALLLLPVVVHLGLLVATERDLLAGGDGGLYATTGWRLPFHWMAFFCVGILIAGHRERLAAGLRGLPVAAPLLLALHAGLVLSADARLFFGFTTGFFGVAATGTALAFVFARAVGGTVAERGLAWLGRSSFPIYLSHVLWLKLGFLLLGGVVTGGVLAGAVVFMFAASIAYAAAAGEGTRPAPGSVIPA